MEDGSGWRSPLIKDDFGRGGTGSGGLLRLIRSLKLCCPRPASWSTNLQRQECVMDLFVPALASNPCADKAHCAGKAGRLAKRGNASRAQIWGQPGGKPPLGAHDCVGSALKPSRILRPCRLVLHAQRGFRGDEQVHDTLQTLSDNRGFARPSESRSRVPRNRRRSPPLPAPLLKLAIPRLRADTHLSVSRGVHPPVTMFVPRAAGVLASQIRHDCCPQSSMIRRGDVTGLWKATSYHG